MVGACDTNVSHGLCGVRLRHAEGGRLAAVDVGKAILAGQVADGEDVAGVADDVGVFGEGADSATEILGRFGDVQIKRVRGVGGHYALGSHEAGGERDCCDVVRPQLVGHAVDHAEDDSFGDVVKDVSEVVVIGPSDRAHDEAPGLTNDERRCKLTRDDVGTHAGGEHSVPEESWLLPKWALWQSGGQAFVAGPDIVYKQIETAGFGMNAFEQSFDVGIHGVVAPDGDSAATSGGDFVGGIFNRAGKVVDGRRAAGGATGDINGRACFAEDGGDSAAGTAARASYDGNFVRQCLHDGLRRLQAGDGSMLA